jgi:AbrB family looped-hinge helix DNA binding protein
MNAPAEFDKDRLQETVKIAANGRMVLPKSMRDAVGITGETELVLTMENGQIRIATFADRVREAQEIFRKSVKRPFSSDDFLATRERD